MKKIFIPFLVVFIILISVVSSSPDLVFNFSKGSTTEKQFVLNKTDMQTFSYNPLFSEFTNKYSDFADNKILSFATWYYPNGSIIIGNSKAGFSNNSNYMFNPGFNSTFLKIADNKTFYVFQRDARLDIGSNQVYLTLDFALNDTYSISKGSTIQIYIPYLDYVICNGLTFGLLKNNQLLYKSEKSMVSADVFNYTFNYTTDNKYYFDRFFIQTSICSLSENYRIYFSAVKFYNASVFSNEFPKLDLKVNKSFLCLSPDQDQTCIDFSYNVSDPENDSVIFGLDTDLKPETIMRSEYLEEPEGIFISNPITMINALNSDPNLINNFDNLSCSVTQNIVQQQANTKCINVIQANTPNNTQRVNSIMFNTFSRGSSGNYFGFYLPTQSRNLANSFRFFFLSEFPNIYHNYSFYTDLSLNALSNYGFMYNNTANTYKIVRNNQYITDISRSYIFPDGKSDLIYLGFENYINLEDNNNTEYFKLFVKRNNGNKTYIYTSSIFSVIPSSFNSLLYSFRISTNSNLSVSFWNSFKTESFQRTPNLNLNALPDKICYSDLGEYTTRIYYSDLPHAPEYKQTDLYLSVYDNETNPLCFFGNGISITQYDFDNPEILPDQDNFFNQILAFLRIFTILASQLGFLTTLRILVKVAILYLVYRLYVSFANLGIPATDIFRRIFIILFFLNFVLYLALLIDKVLFVIFSLIGILYISYEINAVGQGSQAQDTDKAFLYSTAFFSLLSYMYFGFLQLTFRARFGIPAFPDFVFSDLQSGLNTILGFFGFLFGLLFYTIPEIPQFINIIFIIFRVISVVSLIIVIRNFINPVANA